MSDNHSRLPSGGSLTAALLLSTILSTPLAFALPAQAAEQTPALPLASLPELQVEGEGVETLPTVTTLDPRENPGRPVRDGGDFLRSVPGVDGSRMGGHGVDPVIRGQKYNQVNIIDDDAMTFGGCPNRMDPPSGVLNLELADRIEVTKGYQSVLNGPGGSGGTVRTERDRPQVSSSKPWAVRMGGGYDSNGAVRDSWADAAGGTEAGYIRAGGKWKDSGNYSDGKDHKVRSAFTQEAGSVEAGWTPRDSLLSLGYEYNSTSDALFAGAGMDAPVDETNILRLKAEKKNLEAGALTGVSFSAYGSMLDHTMDNFSLRTNTGTKTQVDSESDTWGGKASADLRLGSVPLTVGTEVQDSTRTARRYSSASTSTLTSAATLESVMWPDIGISQYSLFSEGTVPLKTDSRLKLGARYDRVEATWGAADDVTRVNTGTYKTANQLYRAYYGTTADDQAENNVGGLVRYEQDIGAATLFAGVSRSVRTADATERGIAGKPMGTGKAWVGNPDIDPEQHHQADLGMTHSIGGVEVSSSVWYDRVTDFILRDTARGQAGILKSDGATIYRNVNAALSGFEMSGRYRFNPEWSLDGGAGYTYAQNLDDHSAIAQIPPLHGTLGVTWSPGSVSVSPQMRWAATQTRVDTSTATGSGLDVGKTSGYAVFDLAASYAVVDGVTLDAGISNLFDHTYAEHLNRSSSFDNSVVQVNEPGRSFWMRGRASF